MPNTEISERRYDQNHKEKAARFVIEEQTGQKKEGVPESFFLVDQRIHREHQGEKSPEIKLGEKQRLVFLVEQYVSDPLLHQLLC